MRGGSQRPLLKQVEHIVFSDRGLQVLHVSGFRVVTVFGVDISGAEEV